LIGVSSSASKVLLFLAGLRLRLAKTYGPPVSASVETGGLFISYGKLKKLPSFRYRGISINHLVR